MDVHIFVIMANAHESIIECPVYTIDAIIKDLGVLNEEDVFTICMG